MSRGRSAILEEASLRHNAFRQFGEIHAFVGAMIRACSTSWAPQNELCPGDHLFRVLRSGMDAPEPISADSLPNASVIAVWACERRTISSCPEGLASLHPFDGDLDAPGAADFR